MRPFPVVLTAIVLAYAALPWALAVVPGHDLPQHLAYARVLRDLGNPALGLDATFYAVQPFDPYFLVHHVLAALGAHVEITTACRLLYSVYAVALCLSSVALCRAVWPGRTPWPALVSTCWVWNPVTCMGFLPFQLALPGALLAVAAYVRAARRPSPKRVALAVAAFATVALLHVVAGAMAMLFVGLHVAWSRRAEAMRAALSALAGACLPGAILPRGPARISWSDLARTVVTHGPLHGAVRYFHLSWTCAAEKARLVLGTVPGPFTTNVKLALGATAVLFALGARVARSRSSPPSSPAPRSTDAAPYVKAAVSFAALAFVVPTALQVPDDLSLIDLRMFVMAALLAAVAVPPGWFAGTGARIAGAGYAVATLAVWALTLSRVSAEAEPAVRLSRALEPRHRVLGLAMHGSSAHLDASNALTHYLPVYALVEGGAPVTSFWGDFARHLPVGWRTPPPRPPDWAPAAVERAHIDAATHVLLERADSDDGDEERAATARLLEDPTLEPVRCDARWCLLRVRPRPAFATNP